MNFCLIAWEQFLTNRFGVERPILPITDLANSSRSNQKLQRRLELLKFTPQAVIIPANSRILTNEHTTWLRTNILGRYHIHTTTIRIFFEDITDALTFYFIFG